MSELWTSLVSLVQTTGSVITETISVLFSWSIAIFAVAWVSFAIDWRKFWPALGAGTIIPLLLVAGMSAFVWGFLAPADAQFVGMTVPNYLWQVLATALLLGLMFFCGWLQMRQSWFPPEIEFEPAGGGHGHDHHHGDGHGHDHGETHAEDDDAGEPPPVPAQTAHHAH